MKKFAIATAVLAAALALAGCASPEYTPAESAAPAPSATAQEAVDVTSNGNIPKEIGEAALILFPGTDINAVTITVTGITRDPECPSTMFYMPPENGQFVAIDFEIQTSPDYLETQPGQQPLSVFWQDWSGYASDGTVLESTPAGFGCFEEDQLLPMQLAAGETIVGKYVLDLAPDATSFSWKPSSFSADSLGWEWQIP